MPPVAITFDSTKRPVNSRSRVSSMTTTFTRTKVAPISPKVSTVKATVAKPKARRKITPTVLAPTTRTTSLTPLLEPILNRCLAKARSPSVTPQISPPQSATRKLKRSPPSAHSLLHAHPYSRASDLGNDRSLNPSPREIQRAARLEVEKVKAKKESAAAARAQAALKRRSKGLGATTRTRSTGTKTRSVSPTKLDDAVPRITTEPASTESTPAPAPRIGLKRTRSGGHIPLTITVNNAHPISSVGVGSPLRSVHGADDEPSEPKRSRLASSPPSLTRRANTTSPTSISLPLPPDSARPKSDPLKPAQPLPLNRALGIAMRRVVSAGGEALGRDRTRREVTLPGRLREYDLKAAV